MKYITSKGVSVIEVLVGVAILGVALVFISHTIALFASSELRVLEQTQALYLAEEGQEIMRYLRDEDWSNISNLTTGVTYYFDVATTSLATTNTVETINGTYTRSVVVESVRRDGNDDVVASGGTADPGSRVVTVTVSWGSDSVSLESILSNLYNL